MSGKCEISIVKNMRNEWNHRNNGAYQPEYKYKVLEFAEKSNEYGINVMSVG